MALALAFATAVSTAHAAGPGTSTADFLKIGLGARATGMGGAFTAVADDASALYWNPAGLSQLPQQEAGFLHMQWLSGIAYEYGMYAYPHERWGTFGAGFAMLHKGGIASFDETGTSLGEVSARSAVYTAGWGRSFMDRSLSLGVSGKWLREELAGFSADGFAADLGALVPLYEKPRWRLSGGLAIRHLGTQSAFVSEKGQLPRTAVIGLGLKALEEKLSVGLDEVLPRDHKPHTLLGSEYWIHPLVALRAGYKLGADAGSGFSTGAGFRIRAFQFDYSISDFGTLGLAHRGALTWRFGGGLDRLYQEGVALMQKGGYAEAFLKFSRVLTQRPDDRRVILRMKECREKIQEELKRLEAPAPQAPPKSP